MLDVQVQKKLRSVGGALLLDLAFSLQLGERLAIIGASGGGKTTLLRMIAGLLTPDAGKITWQNETWFDRAKKINQPPQKRQVGLMFQDYALFPNMTIRQNLEYALRKGQAKSSVADLIAITELEALAACLPQTLSGGQQQRVALARALVARPPLLLLDEPLSALDAPMREKLQDYILTLQEKYQLTTIWVTHNAEEVNKIANRVLLLENGTLLEQPLKTKPAELTGTIQSIEQQQDQQLVTIAVPSKEELHVGKKIVLRPKD